MSDIDDLESPGVGHNSVGNVASKELLSFIERVERLTEEKAAIGGDIKDVLGEAKGRGYDIPAIRTILKMRKVDAKTRQEQESITESYLLALGML